MVAMRLSSRFGVVQVVAAAAIASVFGVLAKGTQCRIAPSVGIFRARTLCTPRAITQHWTTLRKRAGRNIKCSSGTLATPAASAKEEQTLERWWLMPDGRFRGTLPDGLIVEFEGKLLGPEDPGVVIGPGGVRYVLGEAARNAASSQQSSPSANAGDLQNAGDLGTAFQIAVAAAAATAAAVIVAVVAVPGLVQQPVASSSNGPVTRTNVTIVETRKTLPDGSQARVIDRTTRRERNVPGKPPVVTERTTRTEKVLRDDRVAKAALATSSSAATASPVP